MLLPKITKDTHTAFDEYIRTKVPLWHTDSDFVAGLKAVKKIQPSFNSDLVLFALQRAHPPHVIIGASANELVRIEGRSQIHLSEKHVFAFDHFMTKEPSRTPEKKSNGAFGALFSRYRQILDRTAEAQYKIDDFLAFTDVPWLEVMLRCALVALVDLDSMKGIPDSDSTSDVVWAFQMAMYGRTVSLPGLSFYAG
jgi:hypothetical protein